MVQLQDIVITWVATQSAATGVVIFIAGLVLGVWGFKVRRVMLAIIGALVGAAMGNFATPLVQIPAEWLLPVLGAVLVAGSAIAWTGWGMLLSAVAIWGYLGLYLPEQVGLRGWPVWCVGALLALSGTVVTMLARRSMVVLLSSFVGAAGLVIGFVGMSSATVPVIGTTFRSWVSGQGLVLPVLFLMLTTMMYSFQSNLFQGDMRLGGVGDGMTLRGAEPVSAAPTTPRARR